ncbi:MAG: helix-turn-helix domain-containing protein [Defluviitaleaceae bacterium]|nr:helix-turn-helix domain-containing protein [Defluviitaleaceae bacterium]
MHNHNIGQNIAQLRKEKGITQETLAEAVGITPQSVSKWEVGGSPDAMLLPTIADYFGVSIDRLFGRKCRNLNDLSADLLDGIASLPEDKRMNKVHEYCWQFIFGFTGGMLTREMFDHILKEGQAQAKAEDKDAEISYGRVENKEGAMLIGLNEALPYFLVIPEPEKGWAQELYFKDEHVQMFKLFSDPDALRLMFFLYQREGRAAFTPKLVSKKLGMTVERAEEMLKTFSKYKYVDSSDVEMDDAMIAAYHARPYISFIPFLIFANDICRRPKMEFQFVSDNREKPYLWQSKHSERH